MKVVRIFDYRNALNILKGHKPYITDEIFTILNDPSNSLTLTIKEGSERKISSQIQKFFEDKGWLKEQATFSIPKLKYDLLKENVPIEIEIGHERLVYAVFFKFLSDYSNDKIPAGVMIVVDNPLDFGHSWHNSLESTKRKIQAIEKFLLVPILVISIKP
jgi:hypothetical protein